MKANKSGDDTIANLALTWGATGLGAILAVAMIMLFTDIGLSGAVFLSGILAVVVLLVIHKTMVNPLPAPGTVEAPVVAMPAAAVQDDAADSPDASTDAQDSAEPEAGDPSERQKTEASQELSVPATEASRPTGIDGPRDGAADDLKVIRGVGPRLEEMLNRMGYYHYDQIAAWTDDEVAWVDDNLEGFKGRVSRDAWVEQARELAAR